LFKYTGDKTRTFVNFQDTNRVLDTAKEDVEGQPVRVWKASGAANQRWRVLYVD